MSPVFGGRVSQSEEYKSFRGNIPLKRITVADGKARRQNNIVITC